MPRGASQQSRVVDVSYQIFLQHDVVLEAEIVGGGECRCDAAGGITFHGRDAKRGGGVFAAEKVPRLSLLVIAMSRTSCPPTL
jgi:hypothetical protein